MNNTENVAVLSTVSTDTTPKPLLDFDESETTDAKNIEASPIQKRSPFITANSEEISKDILNKDIVPVFSRSNDTAISSLQFIEACESAMKDFYVGETVDPAIIRGSHIIRGRKMEFIHVPTNQLTEKMKTHYFERVIFAIEVPTIYEDVNNNRLVLSLVGFKNYGQDNLRGNLAAQHFSVAVSLKNTVCENGCIFSENIKNILATSPAEIYQSVMELLTSYDLQRQTEALRGLSNAWMSKEQFIYILGSMKYYSYLNTAEQRNIPKILITESQWNVIARSFLQDENFQGNDDGIDMWRFYNLLTGSNRNVYLHTYLDRAANAAEIATGLSQALQGKPSAYNWFLPGQ